MAQVILRQVGEAVTGRASVSDHKLELHRLPRISQTSKAIKYFYEKKYTNSYGFL